MYVIKCLKSAERATGDTHNLTARRPKPHWPVSLSLLSLSLSANGTEKEEGEGDFEQAAAVQGDPMQVQQCLGAPYSLFSHGTGGLRRLHSADTVTNTSINTGTMHS